MSVGIRTLRPEKAPAQGFATPLAKDGAKVEVDRLSGAPRLITGDLLAGSALAKGASVDDVVAAAHVYIAQHAAELGISVADLELNADATLLDDEDQFLKFRVKRDGLVITDAVVDFRFKRGKLVQVVNQSYAEATTDARALLGGLDRAAEAALIGGTAQPTGEGYRVVQGDKGYELVRIAKFDVNGQDGARFLVQVEAATGKVFELRPTRFFLSGEAKGSAYPRTWWHDEPTTLMAYRDLNLTYSGGTITTDADGKYNGAPATARPTINGLEGSRVRVVPRSGTRINVAGSLLGNLWNITFQSTAAPAAEDKVMAQSMTYYHLNREINHAKRFINTRWLDRQLTANVNLVDVCNAYWDGSTVNLFSAGSGCANTGLISDVYYHEWGHGLDDNTGGIEDGAYSEGFGDIMSLLLTHDNILGKGFMTADGAGVRDLTTFKTYPDNANEEVHTAGLIIAGTFWDLWLALKAKHGEAVGGDLLSKYALKSIFTASKYTDVYDAVLVIDGQTASVNGPNYCVINKAFAGHGLARLDAACL